MHFFQTYELFNWNKKISKKDKEEIKTDIFISYPIQNQGHLVSNRKPTKEELYYEISAYNNPLGEEIDLNKNHRLSAYDIDYHHKLFPDIINIWISFDRLINQLKNDYNKLGYSIGSKIKFIKGELKNNIGEIIEIHPACYCQHTSFDSIDKKRITFLFMIKTDLNKTKLATSDYIEIISSDKIDFKNFKIIEDEIEDQFLELTDKEIISLSMSKNKDVNGEFYNLVININDSDIDKLSDVFSCIKKSKIRLKQIYNIDSIISNVDNSSIKLILIQK